MQTYLNDNPAESKYGLYNVVHHVICSLPSCSTNSFSSSDSWKRGSAKSTTLFFTLPGRDTQLAHQFTQQNG